MTSRFRSRQHKRRAAGSAVRLSSRSSSIVDRLLSTDKNATIGAAALGAAIVCCIGIPLAFALNIWTDEAFTLHTTGAGLQYAWTQAVQFEDQPPLYFLLEAAWRTMDESSVGFARLTSVVFAAASVAALVAASHRMLPRVPPFVVAVVGALHPLVLWAAVEMRVYALVLLLGAILTWAFFEGYLAAIRSRSARLFYVASAILGIYTQYYIGFFIVAQMITLICIRRGMLKTFLQSMACVTVAFAPFLPIALKQVGAKDGFVVPVTILQAVHQILNAIFTFVLPHDETWSGLPKIGGFFVAAILIFALFVAGRPSFPVKWVRSIPVQLLACIFTFSLVLSISGAPLDVSIHFIVATPLALLAAFLFLSSLTRFQLSGASIAAIVFAIFSTATLGVHYRLPLEKQGEWPKVAAALAASDTRTPVATFPAELSLPLSWYYHKPTVPVPRAMPFTSDYVFRTTLMHESDVADVLDPVRGNAPRLWIVTSTDCQTARSGYYNYNCGYLETYLHNYYRLIKNVSFYGSRARLFERTSDRSAGVHS